MRWGYGCFFGSHCQTFVKYGWLLPLVNPPRVGFRNLIPVMNCRNMLVRYRNVDIDRFQKVTWHDVDEAVFMVVAPTHFF